MVTPTHVATTRAELSALLASAFVKRLTGAAGNNCNASHACNGWHAAVLATDAAAAALHRHT